MRQFKALQHEPVLLQEVLVGLNLQPGMIVADGTLGSGGHARAILQAISPGGRLIGIDQDPEALERSRCNLSRFDQVTFHHESFLNLDKVLEFLNITAVDAVILDVGISTEQLNEPLRGFSFERSGPLDMRMNPEAGVTAKDLIHDLSQDELERLFWEFGEERYGRRIAKAVCEHRRLHPIETTEALSRIVQQAVIPRCENVGKRARFKFKRNPATKVFQALRIAVNDELAVLQKALPRIWRCISVGGRLAVISFHSLEDRIVKRQFVEWCHSQSARTLTRKPITAGLNEVKMNPRSRSAKLRIVEKLK